MNIDTLSIARDLRAAELPPEQAEAIAAAIGRAVSESSATKADVQLATAATDAKIDQVRGSLDAKIEQVRGSLDAKIEQVRTEMEKLRSSLLTSLIGTQIAIASVIIAVIKL